MKRLLMLIVFAAVTIGVNAQTTDGTKTENTQTRTKTGKKGENRLQRGSGQYSGSKDTTPGSPMGTSGAGGGDMSNSQAGSAIETADESDSTVIADTSKRTKESTKMSNTNKSNK